MARGRALESLRAIAERAMPETPETGALTAPGPVVRFDPRIFLDRVHRATMTRPLVLAAAAVGVPVTGYYLMVDRKSVV